MTKVDSIRVFMTKRQTSLYQKTDGVVPATVHKLALRLAKAAGQPVDICTEEGDYCWSAGVK